MCVRCTQVRARVTLNHVAIAQPDGAGPRKKPGARFRRRCSDTAREFLLSVCIQYPPRIGGYVRFLIQFNEPFALRAAEKPSESTRSPDRGSRVQGASSANSVRFVLTVVFNGLRDNMLPTRFVGLLLVLLVTQGTFPNHANVQCH